MFRFYNLYLGYYYMGQILMMEMLEFKSDWLYQNFINIGLVMTSIWRLSWLFPDSDTSDSDFFKQVQNVDK